ncbi:MAG: hypothetical protein ABI822_09465, partial [Bryobacteraceae bacterium]
PVQVNRFCPPAESNQGIIGRLGATVRLDGNLALSPNGRYAITATFVGISDDFHTVTDLSSGISGLVAGAFNGSPRRVTNEGTILTPKPSAVILTERSGLTRVLPSKWAVDDAIIDPAGTMVDYSTRLGPTSPARLSAINVLSGSETELTTGFSMGSPQITSGGTTIFFTDTNQLFSIGIGGANRRQVTSGSEPIVSVVVSGDGRVAYAVTAASRLLRIDTATGTSTELISPTPLITATYRVYPPETSIAAVGSLIDLYGSGLDGAVQFTLCGRSVLLQPDSLKRFTRFQVPWDLPEGACQGIISSGSPFEHGINLDVRLYDPRFAPGGVAATNGVIVAYMTGLGPVDGSGNIASGFQCRLDSTPAEVLYAGLAPGFTGFYQVNIRVPASPPLQASLTCGWDLDRQAVTTVMLGR